MKLASLLFASLLVSASAQAQITIPGSALNNWSPSDTIRDLMNVNAAIQANGTWDLAGAVYGPGAFGTTDEIASHPSFPAAGYRKYVSYGLNPVLGYMSTVYWGKNNSGVYQYGEQLDRQAYGIGDLTMNPQDSLVFPGQTVIYNTPEQTMAFPMSFGSSWSNSLQYSTGFELTVGMYGLQAAPGERRTAVELRDSVRGWGKMRLKDVNGNLSDYIDVLVVQTRQYVTDSFYLAGAPAPEPLLTAFGLTQGHSEASFMTRFFRAGEVTPLLYIEHADSTFTDMDRAVAMVNRLPAPQSNGIANRNAQKQFRMYPNPVSGGVVYIDGLTGGYKWSYSLASLNGQVISRGTLSPENAGVPVADVAQGVFTLGIARDGIPQEAQLIIIR